MPAHTAFERMFADEFQSAQIARDTPHWRASWGALAAHIVAKGLGDGTDLAQISDGERWQLMDFGRDGIGFLVCFRHRLHPTSGGREYAHLDVPSEA